jgi:hypothetical protein
MINIAMAQLNEEREILEKYFGKIQNNEHWKNPIDAFCRAEEQYMVEKAIIFFTATTPTFEKMNNEWVRVRAAGYRAGPAGDH